MATPKPITFSGPAYEAIFGPKKPKKGVPTGGIFGPGFEGLTSSLKDFSTALPSSGAENTAMGIATGTAEDFDYTTQILRDLLGMSLEGAQTGFRQDISSLIPQAQSQYKDFLGSASQQFADSNILNGSDFKGSAARESSRLSENLTARQFDENVRASQARGDWTGIAQNLDVLTKSFPMAFAADLYGMGEKDRLSQEQIRGRPYQMFQSLSGAENQVPFFQQGYNANSSSAANLNALSQALASTNLGTFGGSSGGTYNPSNPTSGATPPWNPNSGSI